MNSTSRQKNILAGNISGSNELLSQLFPRYCVHPSPNPRLFLVAITANHIVGILSIQQEEVVTRSRWLATEILLWHEQGEQSLREAINTLLHWAVKLGT